MRYMSLDIETGGLDFEECDILSFCAILDDLSDPRPLEELPVLNCMFTKNTAYKGQPGGLAMNSDLLLKIAKAIKSGTKEDEDGTRYMPLEELPEAINGFLFVNGWKPDPIKDMFYVTVAGKNVGSFDIPFLKSKIKRWGRVSLNQRVMDPAILFFDPDRDTSLPDLQECANRAGISKTVSHIAKEDAMMVVQLLRHKFCRKVR